MRNTILTSNLMEILSAGAVFLVFATTPAFSDDAQKFQGKYEYQTHCATCHGLQGKGNGPMADALKTEPSNLTTLSKKNGGVFPYGRVFSVIEGRVTADAHGSDMPVWGERYKLEVHAAVASARIYELASYVKAIQE